jgi:hypothetical protein
MRNKKEIKFKKFVEFVKKDCFEITDALRNGEKSNGQLAGLVQKISYKKCDNYLCGFCLENIDSGRIYSCRYCYEK